MGEIEVSGPIGMTGLLYGEIANAVREQGFEPSLKEESHPTERRDKGDLGLLIVTWDVLLWSLDHLAAPVALQLANVVAKRIARFRRERRITTPPPTVRVLYGPDRKELARVEVPDDNWDDRSS